MKDIFRYITGMTQDNDNDKTMTSTTTMAAAAIKYFYQKKIRMIYILSHRYRLSLPSPPSQSSFRVLALLFYEEINNENGNNNTNSTISHLPPWVRQEIPTIIEEENDDDDDDDSNNNNESTTTKTTTTRTFIVGTNDEPGFMGGAICAERAAMVQLRFVPNFCITKLVIATDSTTPISPGMLCREFLAGHTSVPWDVPVISTGCICTRCQLRDTDLFQATKNNNDEDGSVPPPCIDGHTEHSIPTLKTTIADLYPYPSPYTRLTATESVSLGEEYSESTKSNHDYRFVERNGETIIGTCHP